MSTTPRSRLAAFAAVGVMALGGLTITACGSDASEDSPATTECEPTDTSMPGQEGSSDSTLVGNSDNNPGRQGGSAGAVEGDQEEGSNSAAGGAPDPSTPDGDDDSSTGNADTGSGGSSRTC